MLRRLHQSAVADSGLSSTVTLILLAAKRCSNRSKKASTKCNNLFHFNGSEFYSFLITFVFSGTYSFRWMTMIRKLTLGPGVVNRSIAMVIFAEWSPLQAMATHLADRCVSATYSITKRINESLPITSQQASTSWILPVCATALESHFDRLLFLPNSGRLMATVTSPLDTAVAITSLPSFSSSQ